MLRRLYDWVLGWADSPVGGVALFLLAVAESSFFPIPPDVLLLALCVGEPKRSFRFAGICAAGSVIGGCIGYFIGWQFMAAIGEKIVTLYGVSGEMDRIGALYREWDAWAVGIAGFTPIPYKVFTLTAGMFRISFPVFVLASFVSRSLRFVLLAGLVWKFGPGIRAFIDRHFDRLALLFTVLLVGGFFLIRMVMHP